MVLAQIGTHHQHALQLRQRGDAGAEPAHGRHGLEFGIAQAVVDVVTAQTAHQRAGQVKFFQRAVRTGEHTNAVGAVVSLDLFQAICHVFQRGLPVNGFPLAALLEHGAEQTLVAVQRFIRKAVAVGDPAFIDVFIFQRYNAHHLVGLDLNDQVCTGRIVRADGLAARQLPGTGAVTKRLAGQRADRADVNHVARQLGVNRHADKGFNFGILAAVRHAQLHHAGDFLTKAHTTCAVDAAAHLLHGDQRPDILVEHDTFFFFVTRCAGAVAHSQILQLALAALVADRAIQRMVDQQKLHHALLRFDGLVVLGVHHHALCHGRGAGRHWFGRLLHINQTHAAVGSYRQFFVITKMRNIGAGFFSRMHDGAAFAHVHLLAV